MAHGRGRAPGSGSQQVRDQLPDLIDTVYATAADPHLWQDVAEILGRMFPMALVAIHAHDVRQSRSQGAYVANLPEADVHSYVAHYSALNPYPARMVQMPEGAVYTADDLVPREKLIGTEYFHDWLLPHGDIRSGAGCNIVIEEDRMLGVSIQMPLRWEERALPDCLWVCRRIAPHAARAFRLSRQFAEARRQDAETALGGLLHAITLPTFMLDRRGCVEQLNAPASKLLHAGRGIAADPKGRLRTDPVAQNALDAAIARAVGELKVSEPILLPAAGITLAAVAVPLLSGFRDALTREFLPGARGSVLFVLGLEEGPLTPEHIMAAFGVTPAEARLGMALVSGETLADYAEMHGITKHTARTQMRSLLSKVGASRQAELVRQILGHPLIRATQMFGG